MLSQTPGSTTPADDPRPDFGAPTRARHSPEGGPGNRTAGRHRRVGAEPADKFLLDIPTAHRPTTLADSPPTYRAAFLTDDIPWSRPSVSDETPRYRASRAAEHIPRPRAAPPVAPAEPALRPRRTAAPGRRRARQDTAWDKAAGAVQRAAIGLTRRSRPARTPSARMPSAPAHGAVTPARSIVVSPLPSGRDASADRLRPRGGQQAPAAGR